MSVEALLSVQKSRFDFGNDLKKRIPSDDINAHTLCDAITFDNIRSGSASEVRLTFVRDLLLMRIGIQSETIFLLHSRFSYGR